MPSHRSALSSTRCRVVSPPGRCAEEKSASNHGPSPQALSQPPTPWPRQERREACAPPHEHPACTAYAARPQTMVGAEALLDQQQPVVVAGLRANGNLGRPQWLVEYVCLHHEHAGDLAVSDAVEQRNRRAGCRSR